MTRPIFIQQEHWVKKTASFLRPGILRQYPSLPQCYLLFFVVSPSLGRWKARQTIRIALGGPHHQRFPLPRQEALVEVPPSSGSLWQDSPIAQPRNERGQSLQQAHRVLSQEEGAPVLHNTVDESFIDSLRRVLTESSELHAIVWTDSGCSFTVIDVEAFKRHVLARTSGTPGSPVYNMLRVCLHMRQFAHFVPCRTSSAFVLLSG